MLTDTIVAWVLLAFLICFALINLHNVITKHRPLQDTGSYAEIEHPSGILVGLAAVGTLMYFAETVTYQALVFSDLISLPAFSYHHELVVLPQLQTAGLVVTASGYCISIWSVISRGKYASSWEMKTEHRLVTWGPYRFVRHPSYLGYFLVFLGLVLAWPNPLTAVPLIAIPGYYGVAIQEEKLLVARFDGEYLDYREKTGRFFPRMLRRTRSRSTQR